MKILSTIKNFAKRSLVTGAVAAAALGAGIFMNTAHAAAEGTNCDANAVVWCGAPSATKLDSSYEKGDSHNSASSIQHIYSWFGISSSEVSSMGTTSVEGYVTKTGDVYAGSTLVATNALTAGRQNISGSTKVTDAGTTFYTRTPKVSFQDSKLTAMVVMKDGVFQFAILHSCGNPVKATPKKPNYTITKEVRTLDSSTYHSSITVNPGTKVVYRIAVASTGAVPVKNVDVRDVLPAHIQYVDNTLSRDGTKVSNDSDFFTSKGVIVSSITNGGSTVFTFEAIVGPNDTPEVCSPETLNNEGIMTAPGLPSKNGNATVNKQCLPKPTYACSSLTAKQTDSNSYSFTAKAAVTNGAKITGYTFDFGDGTTKTVTTGDAQTVLTHDYTKTGTLQATVTANFSVDGKTVSKTGPDCQTSVTIKTPVLSCDSLKATNSGLAYTFTASATASNGDTITGYTFDFGDNSNKTVTTTAATATATHTYAASSTNGSFTATVIVNGKDQDGKAIATKVSAACSTPVTTKPTECKPGVPMGSPACKPSTLACVNLTATPGAVDATGSQSYAFTTQATVDNGTITSYAYTIDGKVVNSTSASMTQTFAPGNHAVSVIVNGKDASGKAIQSASNPKCATSITVKPAECKPGVPTTSSACYDYTCNLFSVTQGDNRTITVSAFNATTTNPSASIKNVTVDWGDSTPQLDSSTLNNGNNIVGQSHQFTADNSYTVTATAHFAVTGQTDAIDATGPNCVQTVSFTATPTPPATPPVVTPPAPTELVNTGAGSVIGIFAAAAIIGTIAHRLFLGRRLSRQN